MTRQFLLATSISQHGPFQVKEIFHQIYVLEVQQTLLNIFCLSSRFFSRRKFHSSNRYLLTFGPYAWYLSSKSLQLCPTLCDPVDCNPPGSSVHWILQARMLEWVVMPSSRIFLTQGSSALAGGFFTTSTTWEAPYAWFFVVVQPFSHVCLFVTPWTTAHQGSLSFTISQSLPKLMSIELAMASNHLPSVVPFSSCLQSFPASESFLMNQPFASDGPKVLEFQLQHQSFNEYSGLISFRIDWFDLLAVQGTLESLLQHHSSVASILWCSAFFMVQVSHSYVTTGKNHSFD